MAISTITTLIRLRPSLKYAPWVFAIWLLKRFFGGARNTSERNMHSKVVILTGGTSGIGAVVARGLAQRGAQLVLLTQHALTDPFLVDYIMDLRTLTNNELITAEQVDLSSLHSIRLFATKWVDNAPPRRLDMVVLCGTTMTPKGGKVQISQDGVESNFAVNYLANFQLLSILSPALRAQPPDRDVRIIFGTCSSYMGGILPEKIPVPTVPSSGSKKDGAALIAINPTAAYATSKLALMTFAYALQKHLSAYARPDKQPMNARVIMVDPGWCRTPGMRRHLSFGSLWGLILYLVMWPLWWLILKSPDQGAETFLHAAMEEEYGRGEATRFIKECTEAKIYKEEIEDVDKQKKLWELSEKAIEALEKDGAMKRAKEKKEAEASTSEEKASGHEEQQKPGSRRSRKQVVD